jgi:hypothetical protein
LRQRQRCWGKKGGLVAGPRMRNRSSVSSIQPTPSSPPPPPPLPPYLCRGAYGSRIVGRYWRQFILTVSRAICFRHSSAPPLPPAPHRACNEGNENHRMRAHRRGLKSHFMRHLPRGIIPSTSFSSGVRGCAVARVTQDTRDEIYLILLHFSRVIRYVRSARVSAIELLLPVNNRVDEN